MTAELANTKTTSPRWLVPLLLLAPIVAIFAPVIFLDRSFAFRDGAHFYHPLFQWIASEWGQGRVPLWNPLENCGLPVLADATSSIFYPGKLIFILPLPFAWLYKFYVIGHVILAAVAMYAFARRLRASEPSAVLVAIAYACGGNVVFQYCNIVFLVGAAWLPAALLAIEVIVSCRCWRAMLLFAFVLAMMILGGDPQMAYHALLAAGLRLVFSLSSVLRGEGRGEGLPHNEPSTRMPLNLTLSPEYRGEGMKILLLGGAAVIAFLLAAVQIFPSSEATKFSERAAYTRPRNVYEAAAVIAKTPANESLLAETPSEKIAAGLFGQPEPMSHHDRAYDYSVSPWRVLEFIWPNISGRAFPQNQRWTSRLPGESKPWTPTMYLGLLPFLVGCVALRSWRTDATTRWLTWLVIIFALGSCGWYGFGWLLREGYATMLQGDPKKLGIGSPVGGVYWLMVTLLPTYIYFRYPAKLMVVAVCGFLAGAAPAVDRLFAAKSERWLLVFKSISIASMCITFGVWCASPYFLNLKPTPSAILGPFNMPGALFDVFSGLIQTTLVAVFLYWGLTKAWEATAIKQTETALRLKWAAVALTAAELAIANGWLIFTAPASLWNERSPVTQAIEQSQQPAQLTDHPRFYRGSYFSWHAPSFAPAGSPQRMEQIARWDHDTLSHKYFLNSGLSLVESYGSLKPLDYESLLLQARALSPTKVDGVSMPLGEALRLTGCEYLVLPASADIRYAEKLATPHLTLPENASVWRMKRTMPRAWIVDHVITLPPLPDPLDMAAVDARSLLVLSEKLDGKIAVRDFRSVAVVETNEPPRLAKATDHNSRSEATAEITLDEPQHVRIKTELSQPGLLVLADSYGPGWIASLTAADESNSAKRTPLTIHRTNRCFRGVALPAGEWLVDFEYRPQSFYRGAVVSALAWCLLIVICGVTWFGPIRSNRTS
jgi:hypothetical protein